MKTQGPEGSGTVVCLEGWKGSYWLGLSSGGQIRATRAGVVKGSWKFKNKLGFRELASYLLEMPVHTRPDPAGLSVPSWVLGIKLPPGLGSLCPGCSCYTAC